MKNRPRFTASHVELESRRLLSGTTSPAALADLAKVVADRGKMVADHAATDASFQADLGAFEVSLNNSTMSAVDVAAFDQTLDGAKAALKADWAALAKAADPAAINSAVNQIANDEYALAGNLIQIENAATTTSTSPASVALMARLDGEVASGAVDVPAFRVDLTRLNDQLANGLNLPAMLATLSTTANNAASLAGHLSSTLKDQADFTAFEQVIAGSSLPGATKAQFLQNFLKQVEGVDLDILGIAKVDHSNDTNGVGVQLATAAAVNQAVGTLAAGQASLANLVNSAESAYMKTGGFLAGLPTILKMNLDSNALATDLPGLASAFGGATATVGPISFTAAAQPILAAIAAEKAAVIGDLGAGSALGTDLSAFLAYLKTTSLASHAGISLGIGAAQAGLAGDVGAGTSLTPSSLPNLVGSAVDKVAMDKSALDFWLKTAEAELKGVAMSPAATALLMKLEADAAKVSADIAGLQANLAKLPSVEVVVSAH